MTRYLAFTPFDFKVLAASMNSMIPFSRTNRPMNPITASSGEIPKLLRNAETFSDEVNLILCSRVKVFFYKNTSPYPKQTVS